MIAKRLWIVASYASCIGIGSTSVLAASSTSSSSSSRTSFVPRTQKWNENTARTTVTKSPSSSSSILTIPRGGSADLNPLPLIKTSLTDLQQFLTTGDRTDTLLLLGTTALNAPLCQKMNLSPILGFLVLGLVLKTQGWIGNIHRTEQLADLGIVLFLFEMGLHLDLKTLMSMKRDVFGIGLGQFTITATALALLGKSIFKYSTAASVIVGWSLALSSSAFVLQLLKDKEETNSPYGRSSFGTLLLQDLMVVPLLVITPLLAGTGDGTVPQAIAKSTLQIGMAVSAIGLFGKLALTPLFNMVTQSANNQESTIAVIFATLLSMSFLTEGLGLSNTLGAFLSGMMLAETPHRHLVEVTAAPFRGILVGIFFLTVGFEIDLGLIAARPLAVAATVGGILTVKTLIATCVCLSFGHPLSIAQRVGLVLSQGGEFAFVAFRTARGLGILGEEETKYLLTCVALTMALTPALEGLGGELAGKLEIKEKGLKKKD